MLKFRYRLRHRPMSKASGRLEDGHGTGPAGRIQKLRELVTALVRHERIEGKFDHLDETRPYAELLIQKAQKYGDRHKETMDLADYWLLEKDLVHKLFKVLAPRYDTFPGSYTRMHMLPKKYPGKGFQVGCLELKGNPWPPVKPHHRDLNGTLINVLVGEMRREHGQLKAKPTPQNKPQNNDLKQTPEEPTVPKDGTPV